MCWFGTNDTISEYERLTMKRERQDFKSARKAANGPQTLSSTDCFLLGSTMLLATS